MKKRLFITNTYFQLITAINLQMTEFENEKADIFVTDLSANSEVIVERLKQLNIFENVYNIEIANKNKGNKVEKIKRLLNALFKNNGNYQEITPMIKYDYDELLFYNYDLFSYFIFQKISTYNNSAKWSRFEEGYISYFYENHSSLIVNLSEIINKIKGKKSMLDYAGNYYVYDPDLLLFVSNNYELKKMPSISRENYELKVALNKLFNLQEISMEYNYKYVFFEESFFVDNIDVDDFSLIESIAEIVGKENILIKLHPRNKEDRFQKIGIATNKSIGVPWEVLQMNYNFSSSILLTISSGSVISSKILFQDDIETYLLYECLAKLPPLVDEKYKEYLSKFIDKYSMKNFYVPNSIDEFRDKLYLERDNYIRIK